MEAAPVSKQSRQKISGHFKTLETLVKTFEIIQKISKLIFWIFLLGFLVYLFSNPIFDDKWKELVFIVILTGLLLGLAFNHNYGMEGVMNKLVKVTNELYDRMKEAQPFQETEIPSSWIKPLLAFLDRLGHLNDSYRITRYYRPLTTFIFYNAFFFPLFIVLIQLYYIPNMVLLAAKILAFLGCLGFYGELNTIPADYIIHQTKPKNSDYTITLFRLIASLNLFKTEYWSLEDFKLEKINKGISLLCNSLAIRIRDIIAYGTGIIKSIEVGRSIATLHLAVLSENKSGTLDPLTIIDQLRQKVKALDPKGTLDQLLRIEKEYIEVIKGIESLDIIFFSTKRTWYTMDLPEKLKTLALILGILGTTAGLLIRLLGI